MTIPRGMPTTSFSTITQEAKEPGNSRCECGFRIRGPNHEEGRHHRLAMRRMADHGPRSTGPKIIESTRGRWS